MSSEINLSIIIVNYRTATLIMDGLSSVDKYCDTTSLEIIIVSNSSNENEQAAVLEKFGDVRWIEMNYNAGFARANNAGMKAARGNTILLLNPDTLALDDSINQCYQQLSTSDFVAVGVQLLDAFKQPQISGNFFVKKGLNHLLPIPYWGGFIRWLGYRTQSKIPNVLQAAVVEEVDWISGAFLMVKKSAIEKAGLMDEDFFLYAEEVEWCSRLKKIGRLCIFGNLHIIHLEGGSINKEQQAPEKGYYNLFDKKGLQLMVSNHLRVRKQYGKFWFLFLLVNYTWGVLVFFVAGFFHRLFQLQNPFGHFRTVSAFAKNVLEIWKLTPLILSGKPHFYKMF